MKILLIMSLLIGCGVENKKEEEDDKGTDSQEASGNLAAKYEGKTITGWFECHDDLDDDDENPSPTILLCDYTRKAENSECGKAGDACYITIQPRLPTENTEKNKELLDKFSKDKSKDNVWPLLSWDANCSCQKESPIATQPQREDFYNCNEGECSLEKLQDGILKSAWRNGKSTSANNKLNELEEDLLKDIVKDAFENLLDVQFTDKEKKEKFIDKVHDFFTEPQQ